MDKEKYGATPSHPSQRNMTPVQLDKIRLMNCLCTLADMLAWYGDVGYDWGLDDAAIKGLRKADHSAPIYHDPETQEAENALRNYRCIEETLLDASELIAGLPPSERIRRICVALSLIDLKDAYVPAEAAMIDAQEEAAIYIISEAVQEAYELAWLQLKQSVAEFAVYDLGGEEDRQVSPKRTSNATPQMASGAIENRFTFNPGQVLFGGKDLELPSGEPTKILKTLVQSFGSVVPYTDFDEHYRSTTPGSLPKSVTKIRKSLREHNVPCEIKSKTGEGYLIRGIPSSAKRKERVRKTS